MKNKLHLVAALMLAIASCKDDNDDPEPPGATESDVYAVNEGGFGAGNASISFWGDSSHVEDLFQTANGLPLGDVAQSMCIYNSKAYIVVNNSQKVEVVTISDFKKTATITGFASPRYFLPISSTKAFVSDWSNNVLQIINLTTNTITGTIPTGTGPEQMTLLNNKVFVCNVGGFSSDSSVTVIDANTNAILSTIHTGVNPNSIQTDINGKLWVLCMGSLGGDFTPGTSDDIGGKLLQIDPSTYAILKTFDFAQGEHPVKMDINKSKNRLYYLGGNSTYTGKVFRMNIIDTSLPSTALIDRELYGLGISPVNEHIYGGIGNFSISTYILHYNSDGAIQDSVKAGIAPNSFEFN